MKNRTLYFGDNLEILRKIFRHVGEGGLSDFKSALPASGGEFAAELDILDHPSVWRGIIRSHEHGLPG